jgi:hypothetical protein
LHVSDTLAGNATLAVRVLLGPESPDTPPIALERLARSCGPGPLLALQLGPLIVHHWGAARGRLSPEASAWFDTVRDRVHADAAAMFPRVAAWEALVEQLVDAGLPVCLLKGSAQRALGRALPGRAEGDLDLLVPRAEVARVEDALRALDYTCFETYLHRTGYLEEHFHLPFQGPAGLVEVHWALGRATPPGATERIWSRTRSIAYRGRQVRVLHAGDQHLHACVHVSNHAFGQMGRWLGELALDRRRLESADRRVFEAEAAHWAPRVVQTPLRLIRAWGEPEAHLGPAIGAGGPSGSEARLPVTALTAAALGTRPRGMPERVLNDAIGAWLSSRRGWSSAVAGAWLALLVDRLLGRPRSLSRAHSPG